MKEMEGIYKGKEKQERIAEAKKQGERKEV